MTYRGFKLNDADIQANISANGGKIGDGIYGCIIDTVDYSDVDVRQSMTERSQTDGMDTQEVFKGARRIRMTGTLYGPTRGMLFDLLWQLRAALDPVLAQREVPADKGYRPLYFATPTNRLDEFAEGQIDMQLLAMPRSINVPLDRDAHGGDDRSALAVQWQALFLCRDPRIYGAEPVDNYLTDIVGRSGTAAAAGNRVTSAAHGLADGDRIFFTTLTGGTGLSYGVGYYVRQKDTDSFKVATTNSDGTIVNILSDYSTANWHRVETQSFTLLNRGTYLAPLDMLFVVNSRPGTLDISVAGSTFKIVVPQSTGTRIIRYKGTDRILTIEEDSVELLALSALVFSGDQTHPVVPPGESTLSVTITGVGLDAGSLDGSHAWFWEAYS